MKIDKRKALVVKKKKTQELNKNWVDFPLYKKKK